jgi:bifunctional diaminopimelate decarboxylase / aspartate kinase
MRPVTSWIVLKFGGSSVSSLANWRNIAQVLRQRRAAGAPRVLVVHSALTGMTDRLEMLLDPLRAHASDAMLFSIEERHRELAGELAIPVSGELLRQFAELRQMAAEVAVVGAPSDRMRARVLASGELMVTELGVQYLRAQGLDAQACDARGMLRASDRRGASAKASILSATCSFAPDVPLLERLARLAPIIVTQGFIASDSAGNTVVLGRGGSDTSAAYFAAKLSATRLEIWSDVPGMFSANPRSTPTARLLRALHYDEAQEIASNGAKVLHPRCILPARQYRIPIYIYATQTPELEGTVVSHEGGEGAAHVKAICIKKGITLVALDSPGMWHQVGFLADAFQIFKAHGMSVDLVSTSETNVTVSLDPAANSLDGTLLDALVVDLERLCRVQVIAACAAVSLVGRNIRAILHRLGDALELFAEQKIYLVTQAANDLNFTFVVDENQGERLVEQLHELLIRPTTADRVFGPTWEQLFAHPASATASRPWWHHKRGALLAALAQHEAAYVYDQQTIRAAARALRALPSVARVLYAMKANAHPQALRALRAEGVDFECVSRGEVERVLELFPEIEHSRILFTPNFAARAEYAWALGQGLRVTVDNTYGLSAWPALFAAQEIFLRIDTGAGRGHHQHVRTAGASSKFGVPVSDLDEFARYAHAAGARIVGLHAHAGSGIFNVSNWHDNARLLAELAQRFVDARVIDVGGGFGVPEREGEPGIDLGALDAALEKVRAAHPALEIWIEPGRYMIAAAGVLLARVTQLKSKGEVRYVGIATGMNSLIRPALYGAYHEIVNLTRLDEPLQHLVNVVGPICESGDILGHDRLLPETREGDVLLIANAGAYGHVMSSRYNLREPAVEVCI